MTTQLPRESGSPKMRADAFAIFALGAVSAVSVVLLAIGQFTKTFTAAGVAWRLPVEPHTTTADGLTSYKGSGPVDPEPITGTVTHVLVTVPDLNPISTFCLGAAIVFVAAGMLVIIASTVRIAWLFQQGRFFTLSTSRAVRSLTIGIIGGFLGAFISWNLAKNGIEGALNVQASNTGTGEWWGVYWLILFAVTSFGLIDIALRRAIRIQHDSEGLV